jgi:hypothetical protein
VCFAVAELAIAAFGFFSADLYYGVLYQRFGHIVLRGEARGALLFVSLLWPTFFMGVSLPTFGLDRSLQLSAAVNVLAAIGVAPILSQLRARPIDASDPLPASSTGSADDTAIAPAETIRVPLAIWAAIYAMSGSSRCRSRSSGFACSE